MLLLLIVFRLRAKSYIRSFLLPATRTTKKEKVWTRIAKTGLYGYRTRKVSVVACSRHTKTLVPTMEKLDGVGEPSGEGKRVLDPPNQKSEITSL